MIKGRFNTRGESKANSGNASKPLRLDPFGSDEGCRLGCIQVIYQRASVSKNVVLVFLEVTISVLAFQSLLLVQFPFGLTQSHSFSFPPLVLNNGIRRPYPARRRQRCSRQHGRPGRCPRLDEPIQRSFGRLDDCFCSHWCRCSTVA